ncbi:ABC transporter ATP-binding protein [Magnetospirillum sp. UT-4]|uniref:ABC transporter ATP-binding protein n=1 Tax=Magnetospirillum sp. UT-4 TaxID=2681467 RepID=UPI0013822F52|nr:ABC transporter ATP-binding protein [Magnetospirillum sp. UT-4]CAA7626607.1 ABC-type multidrug transport system, ATPase component [Magnetospirillum sp. UT-4]
MIRFQDVAKTFRRTAVLERVSLDILKGDRIALVGSNGAGKTTLIRCLLGEYVHEGRVWVDGLEPRRARREVLARVGFVPQIPPPLKMPVGELVGFAASVCGSDPARMVAVMAELGLDYDRIRRLPFVKLSGGMKQKTLIGVALGRPSDILIMDEPAANLDPEARHIFFRLLAARKDDGIMLITSHRLDEVAALVNRVVEMDMGRVVLDDRVADTVDMASRMACRVTLVRPDEAFARTIADWGFEGGGTHWRGPVNGPDRLRFFAMLSRYTGLIAGLEMAEGKREGNPCATEKV